MHFGAALEFLKSGKRMFRERWADQTAFVKIQLPEPQSKLTQPYYCLYSENENVCEPWFPSHTDMLADDWKAFE